ncbi:MAG: galactose mutarotase [Victivallaceae bacterium]|nr:galactose mutarotase [Victivallaceae bacterium]
MTPVTFFSLPKGACARLFTLIDGDTTVRISDFGAALIEFYVRDRDGKSRNILLGRQKNADYQGMPVGDPYFGATVGRFANRICKGTFSLDAKTYHVPCNDHGIHALHGGPNALSFRLWTLVSSSPNSLVLEIESPNGDNGFPGALSLRVSFCLSEGRLTIEYRATCNAPTVVNFTNHAYFNLEESGTSVDQHLFRIAADSYTPVDDKLIPDGRIVPVEGTAYDLRTPVRFADSLKELPRGFDTNFVLNGEPVAAEAFSPATGIVLECTTTEPGLQFYSGYFLEESLIGRNRKPMCPFGGFCFEAQHFPDSPNHPNFPSTRLAPGEIYTQTTSYRAYVRD